MPTAGPLDPGHRAPDPRIVITDRDRGAISAIGQNIRYNNITVDARQRQRPVRPERQRPADAGQPISLGRDRGIQHLDGQLRRDRRAAASAPTSTPSPRAAPTSSTVRRTTPTERRQDGRRERRAGNDCERLQQQVDRRRHARRPDRQGHAVLLPVVREEQERSRPASVCGPEGSDATNIVRGLTQQQVDQIIAASRRPRASTPAARRRPAINQDRQALPGQARLEHHRRPPPELPLQPDQGNRQPVISPVHRPRLGLSSYWYVFDKRQHRATC